MSYLSSGLIIPWWRSCCSAICHRSASVSCMGGAALNRRSPKNPGPFCMTQITCNGRVIHFWSSMYFSSFLWPHKILLDAVVDYFTKVFSLRQQVITWFQEPLLLTGFMLHWKTWMSGWYLCPDCTHSIRIPPPSSSRYLHIWIWAIGNFLKFSCNI